jgi:hypothetical protein
MVSYAMDPQMSVLIDPIIAGRATAKASHDS